ncbi:flavin-containing monooxygenase [Jatrophihabitans sp. DSM 45814]
MTLPEHVDVLIVGAGFGGLAAAIQLDKNGTRDFLVIDRGADVGGTWRDNTYPGATCDVPSQLYSFSFALNPDWTRSFSSQPEIQDYLRNVASSSAVLDRFEFGIALTAAAWDVGTGNWQLSTTAGSLTARVLVVAAGALSEPKLPDIAGLDDFGGEIFHSARWNHDFDLRGKRVAVIGTGASAIQIVPELAKIAERVDVYQRTPPWIMPRRDRAISRWEKLAYRYVPGAQRLSRQAIYWGREALVPIFTVKPGLGKYVQGAAIKNIHRSIDDPALRRQLTPNFALGCKRVLMSNHWYRALAKSNVDLITAPIARITTDSIETADGRSVAVDAIVVATGFTPTEMPLAPHITGKDGQSLSSHWREHGMQAYKGATVAGFPNLFFVVGPNTGLGHSSMVFMIESQVAYLVDAIRTMRRHAVASVEVDEGRLAEYNKSLQRRMKRTVWNVGGCQSWYLDDHGRNVTLWPRTTITFRAITRKFDLDAYRRVPRS